MEKKELGPAELFALERRERIALNLEDTQLKKITADFMKEIVRTKNAFNFSWLGRPVIQIPQDLFVIQELIWELRPDFIIETGIAHGGSIVFYASMLELAGKGKVIGIDIDIRKHNRVEIEKHPMAHRIEMVEGSSVSDETVEKVRKLTGGSKNCIVCLDSNHTHAHVLQELKLYTPFVSAGGYCVVFDTGVEDLPKDMIIDRPWGPGNNPKTAVWEFLKTDDRFVIDKDIEAKILITAAPDGYLKCVK